MRFWNWIRDATTGARTLRLDGAISDETWLGDEVTPAQFRAELNSGEGDVTVWLNSPGGDCFAATEIYNMLKEYGNSKGLVTVKIDALAASAASVVAMAGDVVEISPCGQMFLHNPECGVAGNASELESAIRMLREVKESILNAYQIKTKLPRAKISELMDAATWLNAQKAIELGFADKILYTDAATSPPMAKMFSVMQITASLAKAFQAERKKAAEDSGVDAQIFRRRLKILQGE